MTENLFKLHAPYAPTGDQPQAIRALVDALSVKQVKRATLLGVTGSGKTFTMANVIAQLGRPALIVSHNKTLAAQLYSEFKGFFPENAVEYFVSYYDYYQPEAYVPGKDLYIEKDAAINPELDKLRLSATRSLLSRRDVVIVASVSSIYGLGSPRSYADLTINLAVGQALLRDEFTMNLVGIQYQRNDIAFTRGKFRVRGDIVEIWPAYDDNVLRVSFFGDEIEELRIVNALTGNIIQKVERINLFPAKHFVVDEPTLDSAVGQIQIELDQRHAELMRQGALLEASRLHARTRHDLELMRETGGCPGIENYSRYLTGRKPGERPYCLYDFFPPDFLTIVDESHVSIPQIGGMFAGDLSRKTTLIEHGFRLPSALDNRPMRFDEWEGVVGQTVYVSATPGPYEAKTEEARTEQLIRPTGLLDPLIQVRPTSGQVDDLLAEINKRVALGERSLVTTLTKRMAEDVAEFLGEAGVKTAWLHSEIDALERIEILQNLRAGVYDVLVGVNLLREGLDLPEVSLVAIFDADKQGFLRSESSLIQTIGRAARHLNGLVVLYADQESAAMKNALKETLRRRAIQLQYNTDNNITPRSAQRSDAGDDFKEHIANNKGGKRGKRGGAMIDPSQPPPDITTLKAQMIAAAEDLKFEEAARLRDLIRTIESGGAAVVKGDGPATFKPARRGKRGR